MFDKEKIKSATMELGLSLIGDPIDDPDVDGGAIIFIRSNEGTSAAANRLVKKLENKLAAEGVLAKIVAPNQGGERTEAFLIASLKAALPDLELDVTLATGTNSAAAWVNLPAGVDEDTKNKIEGTVQRFLNQLEVDEAIVKFNAEKNYPSPTACLRILRRNAPCSVEELTQHLHLPGFDPIGLADVKRFLETARRKGQVIRREDGKYILTLQCLMTLGSKRNRFSPDVSRALALPRLGT